MQSKKNNYTRRDFLKTTAVGTLALTFAEPIHSQQSNDKNAKQMLVYIGTYTSGKSVSEGIYIYKLNLASGALEPYKAVKNVVEPSFLAIDKNKIHLSCQFNYG